MTFAPAFTITNRMTQAITPAIEGITGAGFHVAKKVKTKAISVSQKDVLPAVASKHDVIKST